MSFLSVFRIYVDFSIAIVCTLVEETNVVYIVFNKIWFNNDKRYDKRSKNSNIYTLRVIGRYNVVLIYFKEIRNITTSIIVDNLKSSFPKIKLVLVVRIYSIIPFYENDYSKRQIWLRDIIINIVVMYYDFDRQYSDRFEQKKSLENNLIRTSREIRSLILKLKIRLY